MSISKIPGEILFLVLGFGVLWFIYTVRRQDEAYRKWPTTPGIILSSAIDVESRETGDHKVYAVWAIRISYSYRVDGRDYRGSRFSASRSVEVPTRGKFSLAPEWYQALRDRFPVGASVEVHYNPTKPDECYLYFAPTEWVMFLVMWFFVLALFGGAAAYWKTRGGP